jgi:hypothetical protein
MTRSLLALSAIFFSTTVAAAEPAQSTALPFSNAQLPAAAKTADEAPRWSFTPGPVNSTTPAAATVPGGSAPAAQSAPASTLSLTPRTPPVQANASVETSRDVTAAPRPLQSVMKRRQSAAAAAPTGRIEAPATQPTGNVKPIQIDSPFNAANETAPGAETKAAESSNTSGTTPYDASTSSRNERAATATVPAASNVSPSARYDFPLQLGLPPQTGDAASTANDETNAGLRPVTSTPVLYPVPTHAATTGAQTAVFEAPSQTATVTSDVVQTSATQAVPPTAANETAVDSQKVTATRAAADLLATSSTSPPEPFYGANTSAISLAQALANIGEPNRAAAVNAYWRLSIALRGYHWAVDELTRLEQIASRRGSFETSMLSTARAAAAARIEEAKIQVIRGQTTLESLMAQSGQPLTYFDTKAQATVKRSAVTYMASDSPLVGPYRTYFDVLFASRAAPGRAKEIDRMLPIRWETINDRTAAVQSATSAIHYAEQAHAKGEADIRIVLACHEELYKQRRAFLDAVLNYNIDIADYAVAVAAPGTGNDKLVSMLIYTKQPDRVTSLPARAATSGVSSSTTVAAPTLSTTPTSAATSTRASDGWVPSSLHSLDPLAPRTTTAPRSNPTSANPIGNQPDPFKNLDNRYREFGR